MRRGRTITLAIAASGLLVAAGSITAAAADSPVPGTPSGLSAGTQPASATVGSPSQPNSSATVASGRTSSAADGQNANHSTCGAAVGAGGSNYGAQPTQVGTSGTSTPTCTSGAPAGQGAATTNTAQTRAGAGSTSTGAGTSGLVSTGFVGSKASALMAKTIEWGWLLLALLLAFLFFLIGAGVARRRQSAEAA